MKGKLWELGPFVIAAVLALYFLLWRGAPAAPAPEPAAPAPRAGLPPRSSGGPGDPTKASDFLPDPGSSPDPNSLPDPRFSTATRRTGK